MPSTIVPRSADAVEAVVLEAQKRGDLLGVRINNAEDEDVDRQPEDPKPRAREVLQVADAVLLDAVVVERQKDDDRASQRDV